MTRKEQFQFPRSGFYSCSNFVPMRQSDMDAINTVCWQHIEYRTRSDHQSQDRMCMLCRKSPILLILDCDLYQTVIMYQGV